MSKKLRALYIEDSKIFQSMLPKHLPEYEIVLASTLKEAQSQAFSNPFDLVISDLMLAEGMATDLLCALRAKFPPRMLPIVVLSSMLDPYLVEYFARLGIYTTPKPISTTRLQQAIHDALVVAPVPLQHLYEVTILTWSTASESFAYCPNAQLLRSAESEFEATRLLRMELEETEDIPSINTVKMSMHRFQQGAGSRVL